MLSYLLNNPNIYISYDLRQRVKKNYRELSDTKLPRVSRQSSKQNSDELYTIEIIEEREDEVRIHYVGYSSKHDEWRSREEIVQPSTNQPAERYRPFDCHDQLAYAIKSALVSHRDKDPAVRIEIPFDPLIFQGGLRNKGRLMRQARGEEHYTINEYGDLTPFLGKQWYIRGINAQLDFCAVTEETVEFYLHKKAAIVDHLSGTIQGGYVLIFKFVRFDGVKNQLSDFDVHV